MKTRIIPTAEATNGKIANEIKNTKENMISTCTHLDNTSNLVDVVLKRLGD